MTCCNNTTIRILEKGIEVRHNFTQNDDYTLQYFSYKAIESLRYDYLKDDRAGIITLFVSDLKSPQTYRFRCEGEGHRYYEQILAKLDGPPCATG